MEISEEAKVRRLCCLAWDGGRLLTKQSNFPAQRQREEQSIIRPGEPGGGGGQGRGAARKLMFAADARLQSADGRRYKKTKQKKKGRFLRLVTVTTAWQIPALAVGSTFQVLL